MRTALVQLSRRGGLEEISRSGVRSIVFLIDWALYYFQLRLATLSGIGIRRFSVGLSEAIIFSRSLDVLTRYREILKEISCRTDDTNILEVGAGSFGLNALGVRGVTSSDASALALRAAGRHSRIVCASTNLPFRNRSFRYTVSADMLEHVPASKRNLALREILRVSSRRAVVAFPAVSRDHTFDARVPDHEFQYFYSALYRSPNPSAREHIALGQPRLDDILRAFPNLVVSPGVSGATWLPYMKFAHLPLVGFAAGVAYLLLFRRNYTHVPHYRCIVVGDVHES